MKKAAIITLLLFIINFKSLCAQNPQGLFAYKLIERILPKHSNQFQVLWNNKLHGEEAHIYTSNNRICIEGNTTSAIAYAFNYYLRNICHASLSWTGNQLDLPQKLPLPPKPVVIKSTFKKRFMYNYCTFGYTMAFWNWERWEKELDNMAMHGVNLALALVGQEAVWQNTLQKFHFSDEEIKKFIAGPAFIPWWLMGNLEGWGGPVSQHWIDNQKHLQQKILKRMNELGIKPILQGFYSMVPDKLRNKFPDAKITDSGFWLNFKRPANLLPPDSLYFEMAKTYYHEQSKLYGNTDYYIGDLFHEGAVPPNINLKQVAKGVFKALTNFNPNAIWVMQAWQSNPRAKVLEVVPEKRALIIDLMSEASAQYGGDIYSKQQREGGFGNHDFLFTILPNFGGRTGLAARLDSLNVKINRLKSSVYFSHCKGLGASPEATLQDPIFYDLLFDQAWTTEPIDMQKWLKSYITSRYGKYDTSVMEAWIHLKNTVYNTEYSGEKAPPYESIVTTRPAWSKTMTSTWGYDSLDYNPKLLAKAWQILIENGEKFKHVDTYQHDLVNITRQVIDNYAHTLYFKLEENYKKQDNTAFTAIKKTFLDIIVDLDQLLGTRNEFLLGSWLEMAKKASSLPEDQKLNELNARTLITTWTFEPGDVNDYAYREYSGLLKDYYYPRWQLFFARIEKNRTYLPTKKDFFELEYAFTKDKKIYPTTPQGDSWKVTQMLYQKYKDKVL